MKYLGILTILVLFISSCSGGDETVDRGLITTSGDGFSLQTPANWKELSQSELPLPKSGKLVLALASQEEKQGYLNNLVVLSSDVKNTMSSQALVKSNIGFLKQNMTNFSLISEKNISFLDESNGTVILFSGMYNSQTPQAYYLQTGRNCGDANFFVTLSLTEKLESYSAYEYILQSLSCN